MRKIITAEAAIFIAVLCAALFAPAAASAQGFNGFDINQASQYLKYLPPIIKSVTQEPENPKKGDTVKVTANVTRLHFGEDDVESVDSVKLYYTVDGVKWETIDMEQADNKLSWTAEIPAVDTCEEVDYHITAKDTAGNVAMELPGWLALPGWNPPKDGAATADPHDFLTKIYDHSNSDKSGIPPEMLLNPTPPYMNILSMRFGYDDNNYYFRIEFGDPVRQGTVSPLDINLYLLAVINCSLDVIFTDTVMAGINNGFKNFDINDPSLKEMTKYFWVWYYAPLVDIAPPLPGIGKIPGVGLVHLDSKDIKRPIFEINGFKYKLNGNFADITMDRKMVGPAAQNALTFVSGNMKAAGADFMSIKPMVGDISYTSTIILGDHGYEVCPDANGK